MANDIKFNKRNLDDLTQTLQKEYFLRVGIIGSKAEKTHKDSDLTTAEIGTFHEFGSSDNRRPPRRSFLEDSLKFKLKLDEEKMKSLKNSLFDNLFVKKSPKVFLNELGSQCLMIIETAFSTACWGMWKPLAQSTMKRYVRKNLKPFRLVKSRGFLEQYKAYDKKQESLRKNRIPLTDTGQLRRSITFKVMEKQ